MAQTSEQTQDERIADALVEFQAADTAYVNALEAVNDFLRANPTMRAVYFGQFGTELVIRSNPELQRLIAESEIALELRNARMATWAAVKAGNHA
jgi:hypothetical protein